MAGLPIVTAATALPTPPTAEYGLVPADWGFKVKEFDLELWAAASTNLTACALVGATLQAQVLADDDVDTVDATDNEFDIASHAYLTGDGPIRLTTTGTLPAGLAIGTDYWVIRVGAGAISLATSLANALAGTEIDMGAGTAGTHTVVDTADTKRVHWDSIGLLGHAGDGAVALTSVMSYRIRCKHAGPRIVAYSLIGTLSAAEQVSCTLYPVPL
jgi:hypothetical protein